MTKRAGGAALWILWATACGGPSGTDGGPSGTDGGPSGTDGGPVSDDGGVPRRCVSLLAGDAAFGAKLRYDGPLQRLHGAGETVGTVDADVFFPDGRVPRGRVVLAGVTSRGLERDESTLDDALGSSELQVLTSIHGRVTGSLVGPDDGLLGEA